MSTGGEQPASTADHSSTSSATRHSCCVAAAAAASSLASASTRLMSASLSPMMLFVKAIISSMLSETASPLTSAATSSM